MDLGQILLTILIGVAIAVIAAIIIGQGRFARINLGTIKKLFLKFIFGFQKRLKLYRLSIFGYFAVLTIFIITYYFYLDVILPVTITLFFTGMLITRKQTTLLIRKKGKSANTVEGQHEVMANDEPTLGTKKPQRIITEISEWRRKDINEWDYPLAGYKTIPFGPSTLTSVYYENIEFPFAKPLFGSEEVPFELFVDPPSNTLKCIEVKSRHAKDKTTSPEIIPGANEVTSAYILIGASKGLRIIDHVEFEGMRIGYLEFNVDKGEPFIIDLTLGTNIRDISFQHPKVVASLNSPLAEQVWRPPGDTFTLDMVKIDFPYPARTVEYFRFTAKCENVRETYNGVLPSIKIAGLTYKIGYPP